jgi:hypothetical protein
MRGALDAITFGLFKSSSLRATSMAKGKRVEGGVTSALFFMSSINLEAAGRPPTHLRVRDNRCYENSGELLVLWERKNGGSSQQALLGRG